MLATTKLRYITILKIYPEDYAIKTEALLSMFDRASIYDRNKVFIEVLFKGYHIAQEHINELNEMTILLYRGFLETFRRLEDELDKEKVVIKFVRYLERLMESFEWLSIE